MSLWRELRVALTLISLMLLEPLWGTDLGERLCLLPEACKGSKRARLPQRFCFNTS